MAEKTMKWTIDEATAILVCKHKDADKKVEYNLTELYISITWEDCDSVEKRALAYAVQQKLADCVAGKGAKAKYSATERIALMNNKWQSMTVDRTWSEKGGPREPSVQKKLAGMKVISQSMANAAPMLGLKVDPSAVVMPDSVYAEYIEADDQEKFLADYLKNK